MSVRILGPEDKSWVRAVWSTAEREIGTWGAVGSRSWWASYTVGIEGHRWVGFPELGFVHYRLLKRSPERVVDEIVVAPEGRRRGLARDMLAEVGCPVRLKTDVTNQAANALYRSLGFVLMGTYRAKSNSERLINAYLLT